MTASIMDTIRSRHSVRAYTGEPLSKDQWQDMQMHLAELASNYGVKLALLKNEYEGRHYGTYGMIKNPAAYIAAACRRDRESLVQCGIALEKAVLRCTELDLGTCWLGGTFKRREFGSALTVDAGELIPAVISVGRMLPKERWFGSMVRKVAKSDQRKPYGELFFDGGFGKPLSTGSEPWSMALEMVRIGPSASNKQPWRVIKVGKAFHFYEQHAKGYDKMAFDMQLLDMGIAMAHFELAMHQLGANGAWQRSDPGLTGSEGCAYISSWIGA